MAEQELRVADQSGAIVTDSVEKEDPVASRRRRTNFPSAQFDAVFGSNDEIFFRGAGALEYFVNQLGASGRNRRAPWMQNSWADHFSRVIRKDWRNREECDSGGEKYPHHPFE